MTSSVTQRCTKDVSKILSKSLKDDGFRSRSPHIYRNENGIYHIINFQCSQWGDKNEGRFTINLSITTELLYSIWTGKKFPSNPGSATWPIIQRIGHLEYNHDQWFDVNAKTDCAKLGENLVTEYKERILTFFSKYKTERDILKRLSNFDKYGDIPGVFPAEIPLISAILYYSTDDNKKCEEQLTEAKNNNSGSSFMNTVEMIENRIKDSQQGIQLDSGADAPTPVN